MRPTHSRSVLVSTKLHAAQRNPPEQGIPQQVAPGKNEFFDRDYEDNYAQLHHIETYLVHNNWVVGNAIKPHRFKKYHMRNVEDADFPECSRSKSLSCAARR